MRFMLCNVGERLLMSKHVKDGNVNVTSTHFGSLSSPLVDLPLNLYGLYLLVAFSSVQSHSMDMHVLCASTC